MRHRHAFAFVLLIAAGLGLGKVRAMGKDAVELRGATDSIGACAVVPAAVDIARHYGVPIGIEEAPDGCWGKPLKSIPEDWSAHASRGEIGSALDSLVAAAPTYVWRNMDGVVVMRPRSAWAESHHLLARRVGPFSATFTDLAPALRQLSEPLLPRRFRGTIDNASLARPAGLRTNVFPPSKPRPERSPYAVAFGGGTLLEGLNAMVRGHDAAGWLLRYCGAPADEGSATLVVGIHEDALGRGKLIALADENGHADPCLGTP